MTRFFKRVASWWILTGGLLIATVVVWQAGLWTYRVALDSLVATGEERLALYTGTVRGALSRYAYLPYVLARNRNVRLLLEEGRGAPRVNLYLEDLNREAGCDALYVMEAAGGTLASSNWRDPLSFVGQNYGFRPYFTATREGRKGRFFAIGVTTGRPGFFMSEPIFGEGRFLGAAIVKVNLDPLQADWREGGETVLVSDDNGVLFLSSRKDWQYRSLTALTDEQRARIRAGRQYGNQPLQQVPLETIEELGPDRRIVRDGQKRQLMLSHPIPELGWTLFHLAPMAPVLERTRAVVTTGIILAMLILALALYARERRQKQASRRKAREAEAIKAVNLRLQEEIQEHRQTEQALRDTQEELVQSSKLAALGQLATGIVHELNQPISAIRTHAASGRLLLDRRETDKIRETFAAVTRITEHMASISAQLKSFAHQTPRKCQRLVIQTCVDSALSMTAPLLEDTGVSLEKSVPRQPLVIRGGSGQIEQVLVNLIRNGVDAMRNSPRRILGVAVEVREGMVEISVSDSGTGIAEEDRDDLFNPFFTTKEVGQGLGLGLSISYRIVTDLGGTIRAGNAPGGGARFTVRLPLPAGTEPGDSP